MGGCNIHASRGGGLGRLRFIMTEEIKERDRESVPIAKCDHTDGSTRRVDPLEFPSRGSLFLVAFPPFLPFLEKSPSARVCARQRARASLPVRV